jgi:hypothetical protein
MPAKSSSRHGGPGEDRAEMVSGGRAVAGQGGPSWRRGEGESKVDGRLTLESTKQLSSKMWAEGTYVVVGNVMQTAQMLCKQHKVAHFKRPMAHFKNHLLLIIIIITSTFGTAKKRQHHTTIDEIKY